MSQFFLKTQTPSVEFKVTAVDASGTKDTCKVGWKRTSADEGQDLLIAWNDLIKTEASADEDLYKSQAIKDFITDKVLYIKDLQLVDEHGKPALKVPDSRTVSENSPAWGEASNCLPWLLSMFLDSAPWWDAFMRGMLQSFSNMEQDTAKN